MSHEWQDQAACRNHDPELFFPTAEPGSLAYTQQEARARAICNQCPVATQCDTYRGGFEYGVYGGRPELRRRHYNREALPAA